ncbi:MAG: HAMP domain-containing protein [Nitrospirae bacterium]|nr:HAMP domain-containing protein [Nitrospirota bacterium]
MRIRNKFLINYISVAVLIVVIAVWGVRAINAINNEFNGVTNDTLPLIKAVDDLRFAALRIITSTNEYGFKLAERKAGKVIDGGDALAFEEELIVSSEKLYQKSFEKYEDIVKKFHKEDQYLVDVLRIAGQEILKTSGELIEHKKKGVSGQDILKIKETLQIDEISFLDLVQDVLSHIEKDLEDQKKDVMHAMKNAVYTLIAVCVFTIIISLISIILLTNSIYYPIKKLKDATEEIGAGALEKTVTITSKDEIGELAVSFNKMSGNLNISRSGLISTAIRLDQSNKELENFLKISSHDLQEPLRKLILFGGLLKDRYAELLEDQGRDYIERMQKAVQRMQELINDLVTYSQVTTNAGSIIPVDITAIVHKVLADLKVKEVNGRVEVSELPTIDADPLQMQHLFQGLIGNALKFRKKDEPPFVKINCTLIQNKAGKPDNGAPNNKFYQITVEDNGIGFQEEYSERIFDFFQRLHSSSEYGGAGIGLSICRKIAESHGGSITAKGMPGQGAKFIVTLPASQTEMGMTNWG